MCVEHNTVLSDENPATVATLSVVKHKAADKY